MNLKPLNRRLIVERLPERKPANGILIPEAHADAMMRGDTKVFRVLAVGPKCPDVEAGDTVICYSHTDGPQPLDGDSRMVITHDQIIAVVPAFWRQANEVRMHDEA